MADAGKLGAVTIATNMAGRGTDIQLGGNVEMKVMQALAADPAAHPDEVRARIEAEHAEEKERVKEAGGLFVLGTERHESRRIDNQLRGRSGRQGRPGPLGLLPQPRRRPDADLRLRPSRQGALDPRDEGKARPSSIPG